MNLTLKGMRKMIADKMYRSLQDTAQLSYSYRFIDGGPAGDFLTDLAGVIEDKSTFASYLT